MMHHHQNQSRDGINSHDKGDDGGANGPAVSSSGRDAVWHLQSDVSAGSWYLKLVALIFDSRCSKQVSLNRDLFIEYKE